MARADYPEPVVALIDELKRLPGVGPRSAERIALWTLQNPKADPSALARALETAAREITACETCGFFATAGVGAAGRVVGAGGICLEYYGRDVPDMATVAADYPEGVHGLVTSTMCNAETRIRRIIRGYYGSLVF